MIHGFRIVKRRYAPTAAAAFDGEGARRFGGRWNSRGCRLAYASSTLALAAFELLVNVDRASAPDDLVSIHVEIPGGVRQERVNAGELPAGWRNWPATSDLQEIGDRWITSGSSVCLVVPSAVIPSEDNILLNPLHPEFFKLRFEEPVEFRFDDRLFRHPLT